MYGIPSEENFDIVKLTSSIMAHEGKRLTPYTDSTGNLTIGYGHLLSGGISDAAAQQILSDDIDDTIAQCKGQSWWPRVDNDDVRARAFVELVFNLGIGGISKFVRAISAANRADWPTCADEFENSQWYNQVGNRGVILVGMIRNGIE